MKKVKGQGAFMSAVIKSSSPCFCSRGKQVNEFVTRVGAVIDEPMIFGQV